MDWTFLIAIVTIASMALVFPGFEIAQWFAIRAGQIPPRGVHQWHGKPFLHWNHFVVQRYGDLVFLSLLNGFMAVTWRRFEWTRPTELWVIAIAMIAFVATVLWVRSVQDQFAAGKFARWDWGFTYPAGKLTIAGWYHLAYFCLEVWVIGVVLLCFLWKPVGLGFKLALMICVLGYAATAIWDAKTIGLSGGPFAGPKQLGPGATRVPTGGTKPGMH